MSANSDDDSGEEAEEILIKMIVPHLKDDTTEEVIIAYGSLVDESVSKRGAVRFMNIDHLRNVRGLSNLYTTRECHQTFKVLTENASIDKLPQPQVESLEMLTSLIVGYQTALMIPKYAKYATHAFDTLFARKRYEIRHTAEILKCDLVLDILDHRFERVVVDGTVVADVCGLTSIDLTLRIPAGASSSPETEKGEKE
jgi:hypothetical protein